MNAIEHCVEEQIEVLRGSSTVRKLALTYSDFAVIIAEERQYAIVHVPSGQVMAVEDWGGFFNQKDACEAMVEIAGLKNTWAFMTDEDWVEVADQIKAAVKKHGGGRPLVAREVEEAKPNDKNGYDEAEDF